MVLENGSHKNTIHFEYLQNLVFLLIEYCFIDPIVKKEGVAKNHFDTPS